MAQKVLVEVEREHQRPAELIALRKEENASWLQRFLVFVPGLSW
jgi:hypothetical protein